MSATVIAANAADGDAFRAKCDDAECGWAGTRRWSAEDARADGLRHITTHPAPASTYDGPERRRTAAERNAERLEAELEAERERTAELEREAGIVHAELERVWEVLERTADERDRAELLLEHRGRVLERLEAELEDRILEATLEAFDVAEDIAGDLEAERRTAEWEDA